MSKVNLQVPIDKKVKDKATAEAKKLGFSSLQEIIRVFTANLATQKTKINIEQFPAVKLSAKNEKRYAKMDEDIKKGKNMKTFNSFEEFMADLTS